MVRSEDIVILIVVLGKILLYTDSTHACTKMIDFHPNLSRVSENVS